MARIRTIKPEFWCDEKLSPLNAIDRLTFLGLISMADDYGRVHDNMKVIDAFVFPNSDESVRESVANLSRINRIRRGISSSGMAIIEIVNWERHQKVDKPQPKLALPAIRDPLANRSRTGQELFETTPFGTGDTVAETDGQVAIYELVDAICSPSVDGAKTPKNPNKNSVRELVANESRTVREKVAPHTTDPDPDPDHGPPILDQKENDSRTSSEHGAAPNRKKFKPPTLEEVCLFRAEASIAFDAEMFFDHYAAQGWKLSNGRAMVDWMAAARKWARRDEKADAEKAPVTFAQQRDQNTKRAMEDFVNGR